MTRHLRFAFLLLCCAGVFLTAGVAGYADELPRVTGIVGGTNSVTVFATLSSEGTKVLKNQGDRIGSFELIRVDLEHGSADFSRKGQLYRVWMNESGVQGLKGAPVSPNIGAGIPHLTEIKSLAVTNELKRAPELETLIQRALQGLLNSPSFSREEAEKLVAGIRAGTTKVTVLSEKGVSAADITEGGFTQAEADDLNKTAKMGEAMRAAVPTSK